MPTVIRSRVVVEARVSLFTGRAAIRAESTRAMAMMVSSTDGNQCGDAAGTISHRNTTPVAIAGMSRFTIACNGIDVAPAAVPVLNWLFPGSGLWSKGLPAP